MRGAGESRDSERFSPLPSTSDDRYTFALNDSLFGSLYESIEPEPPSPPLPFGAPSPPSPPSEPTAMTETTQPMNADGASDSSDCEIVAVVGGEVGALPNPFALPPWSIASSPRRCGLRRKRSRRAALDPPPPRRRLLPEVAPLVIDTVDLSVDAFKPTPVVNEIIVVDADVSLELAGHVEGFRTPRPPLPPLPPPPAATCDSSPGAPRLRDCPVCLDNFSSSKPVASTFCGHIFCSECVATVMKTSKKCPTCRKKLTGKGYHFLFF